MAYQLDEFYPNGAPIIIQVAFRHGYGPAIVELNRKVYFNDRLSIAPPILEAIQGLCLSSCDNQYCAVMHARGMVAAGFDLEDVKRLVLYQDLPDWVADREKWQHSLRRVAAIFRTPQAAPQLYRSLSEFHPREVIEEIGGIVAFSLLHKFLLEIYSDEIDIKKEPILFRSVDCGAELISFFMQRRGRQLQTFSICSICKDVKSESGWLPVEHALADLPAGAHFSHGICPKCYDRWMAME